jgi:hypothetical protein
MAAFLTGCAFDYHPIEFIGLARMLARQAIEDRREGCVTLTAAEACQQHELVTVADSIADAERRRPRRRCGEPCRARGDPSRRKRFLRSARRRELCRVQKLRYQGVTSYYPTSTFRKRSLVKKTFVRYPTVQTSTYISPRPTWGIAAMSREGRGNEIPDDFGFITWTDWLFWLGSVRQQQWSPIRCGSGFRCLRPLSGTNNPRRPVVQQTGWKSIRVELIHGVTSQEGRGGVDGAALHRPHPDLGSLDSTGSVCKIPLL